MTCDSAVRRAIWPSGRRGAATTRRRWSGPGLLALILLLWATPPTALAEDTGAGRRHRIVAHGFARAPAIDGRLDEWQDLGAQSGARLDQRAQAHPNRADGWKGPADASADVRVGVFGKHLYLGVRIEDDVPHHDPADAWWHWDSLEVFVDADYEPGKPRPDTYTENCWQLFLMPLNPEVAWGVVFHGARAHFGSAGMRDVDIAHRRRPGGYDFEARIPLASLGIEGFAARDVGFALALNDADAEASTPGTYLSWNGQQDLYRHPNRFGVLSIPERRDPTPALEPAPQGWPLGSLVAALLVLAAAVLLAGPGARWLADRGPKPKLVGLGLIALLALGLHFERLVSEDGARDDVRSDLAALAERAAQVANDAQAAGALRQADPHARAADLRGLLRGDAVAARPGVEAAAFVPLHPEGAFQDGRRVVYRIALEDGLALALPEQPTTGVFHVTLERTGTERLRYAGRDVGTLTFEAREGTSASASLSWPEGDPGDTTRRIRIELPAAGTWASLRFEPAPGAGRLTLRQIEAETTPEAPPVALALPGTTLEGVPVLAHPRGPDHGVRIEPGADATFPVPDLLGGADRLWLLLAPERAFPDRLGDDTLASVELRYDVAGAAQKLDLRNGEHLSAERHPRGFDRPQKPKSRVAFRWSDSLGYAYTRIAVPIRLDTARRPHTFTITNHEAGGALRVVAATIVRSRRLPDATTVQLIADETAPQDEVHWIAHGGDVAPHLGPGGPNDVVNEAQVGDPAQPVALRLSAPLPDGVAGKRERTTIALLTCLALGLFLGVLLAVDAADRLRMLSRRLSAGVLAAALVPLAVTILFVDRTNAERVTEAYTDRAIRGAGDIEGRLEAHVRRARDAARRLAAYLASGADPVQPGEVARLVRLFGEPVVSGGLAGSAIVSGTELPTMHVPLGRPDRRLQGTRFLPAASLTGGFHVSAWDGLVAMASTRRGRGDRRVQVTLGLETTDAVLAGALGETADAERGAAVLLDEGGHLLAGTGEGAHDLAAGVAASADEISRHVAGGRRHVVPVLAGPAREHLAVVVPLRRVDAARGAGAWLVLGFPRGAITQDLADHRETLIWLALFGLVLIVGVAALMARRVSSPVRALVAVTDAVRAGSFEEAVSPTSADEIGELTVAFDQMRLDLKHRVGDLDFLRRAQDTLSGSLEIGQTAEQALALFLETSKADEGVLLGAQQLGAHVHVMAARGSAAGFGDRPFEPGAGGWVAAALADDQVRLVHHETDRALVDAERGPARRLIQDLGAWLTMPLRHGRELQGLVVLGWRTPTDVPDARGQRLLVPLAGAAAAALHNARLYRLAALDDVTRLPGATAFEAALRGDVDAALAGGRHAVLLRVGLDHLEHITLRRGVEASRTLLRACADAIRGIVGDRSKLGRLRGEELAVRLIGAGPEDARQVAEAIRERIAAVEVSPEEGGEPLITTASIGIARAPEDAKSLEFLLDAAGRARSAAKREGGDRVETITRVEQGAVEMPPFEEGAIFRNERMVRVVEAARRAARSDASILITGETGTGKEVIATLVHRRSARADRPLVTVNCAAFPETLLESELFGHERGAFTGAERRREGRFELADGGTLFLDEVAEMAPSAQVKLLRVLQERQFTRLGGTRTITVDVRIIAATNRDLEKSVADGTFREDLYYRLNVIRLELPPLRDRREEIPFLVEKFLRDFQRRAGRGPRALTPAAMDVLYRHPWPGNVRELKNAVERCAVLCEDDVVGPEHLQFDTMHGADASALTPRSAPQDELNPRQRALLEYLARHGRATNRVYYEMTGTSPRTALRDLQNLIERGLIVREGKRRGAVYRLA